MYVIVVVVMNETSEKHEQKMIHLDDIVKLRDSAYDYEKKGDSNKALTCYNDAIKMAVEIRSLPHQAKISLKSNLLFKLGRF
jgi:hypothetical protein